MLLKFWKMWKWNRRFRWFSL